MFKVLGPFRDGKNNYYYKNCIDKYSQYAPRLFSLLPNHETTETQKRHNEIFDTYTIVAKFFYG